MLAKATIHTGLEWRITTIQHNGRGDYHPRHIIIAPALAPLSTASLCFSDLDSSKDRFLPSFQNPIHTPPVTMAPKVAIVFVCVPFILNGMALVSSCLLTLRSGRDGR
ncbi:uncharacterized protein BP01DRAFT_11069 [Aspergillus saccharolyticus JOP 1030-1]|uniref:Uncharacterized protein n=1 Tax=Aspergillus saccharolyticus JOP 1030-1 TaxID=1450539 RepID=A0A319A0E6_9EURO|nr:hypothetical protein BP01DRAFT_11069 [Aspergillus saccharolyticus JOP 1030-1]PYH49990.1 hypothetical protein BP01DRAFT_11069 [Aspergillus saccharolyticus JOP 1030-1]